MPDSVVSLVGEEWKPVVGYVGLYEVSNLGNVRALERHVRCIGRWGTPRVQRHNAHAVATTPNTHTGRRTVMLFRDGKGSRVAVARLVLLAFVGPCPEGMECCHNDGDHSNDGLANLRWDSRSANSQDAYNHGVMCRGATHMWAKLTEADVRAIRRILAAGQLSQATIAAQFGVSQTAVWSIHVGKSWSHLT